MKKDNFRLNYIIDDIDQNKTIEDTVSTDDLYNIGGLLDHPIDYTVETDEPVIDETPVSEEELVDNPEEQKEAEGLKTKLADEVMGAAIEKVGSNLWDTVIKGV